MGHVAALLSLTPSTTSTFKVTASDAFRNVVESNTLSVTPCVTDDATYAADQPEPVFEHPAEI
jgi:hypothetical protein